MASGGQAGRDIGVVKAINKLAGIPGATALAQLEESKPQDPRSWHS